MNEKSKRFSKYIEDMVVKNNKCLAAYLDNIYSDGVVLKITVCNDRKMYKETVLMAVLEYDGIILSTCPATLSYKVKFEN